MIINISIDTSALSETDKSLLSALTGGSAPAAAPVAEEKPKKAAPAAKKAPAPKAEAPAPEPAEEAVEEPAEEDLLGGGDDAPTMEDAVALATKMVSTGKTAEVKAALAAVGAKRVSEIDESKIADFIGELS